MRERRKDASVNVLVKLADQTLCIVEGVGCLRIRRVVTVKVCSGKSASVSGCIGVRVRRFRRCSVADEQEQRERHDTRV